MASRLMQAASGGPAVRGGIIEIAVRFRIGMAAVSVTSSAEQSLSVGKQHQMGDGKSRATIAHRLRPDVSDGVVELASVTGKKVSVEVAPSLGVIVFVGFERSLGEAHQPCGCGRIGSGRDAGA